VVVAVEALARWRSCHVLGSIGPAQFIAAAEKSSLINRVTLVLLRKLAERPARVAGAHATASFNLSARTLASPDSMVAGSGPHPAQRHQSRAAWSSR
jgi:predicted signal transduction protein with EAL and GGDEF domain